MTHSPILSVSGLSKSFTLHLLDGKRIDALEDVSFDLAPGEFLAITGRTGAGKSTLIKSVLHIYRPSQGTVIYRGGDGSARDLGRLPVPDLIDLLDTEIGYVSQSLRVVPRVGALDLMIEAAAHADRARARDDALALFAALHLPETLAPVFPVTFSGGEKQRFNLGLTLMRRPRLLVLDEPTAALDDDTRAIVIDLLARLKAEGTSIIAILHDREAVERLADREIRIAQGQISDTPLQRPEKDQATCH